MPTTFTCFTCGAELKWSPKTQNWKCEFCDSEFDESAFQVVEEKQGSGEEASGYRCSYCGAEIRTDKQEAAAFCVFCQRPVVFENQLAGGFKPDSVLPFRLEKKDAEAAIKDYISKRRFLPDAFKDNVEKITGVYVPFWLYDIQADFHVEGTGTILTTWQDSDYRYTKTDTYSFARKGHMEFDSIPVDGSTTMDDRLMDSIEPFQYEQMKPFAAPYLSGFLAQKYDVASDTAFERAKERASASISSRVRSMVGRYSAVQTTTDRVHLHKGEKYVLLPIWLLTAVFQDKAYHFAMNGQTGKFVGDLPVDRKKVLKFSAIVFGISAFVASAVSFISGLV